MIATPTLRATIEAALETSQIIINIWQAVASGEITAAEAEQIISSILRG